MTYCLPITFSHLGFSELVAETCAVSTIWQVVMMPVKNEKAVEYVVVVHPSHHIVEVSILDGRLTCGNKLDHRPRQANVLGPLII